MAKSLIIYYSLDGKTKKVVDVLEKLTNADVYEIELEKPYTKLTAYTIGLGHCKIGYEPSIKDEIDLSAYDKILVDLVVELLVVNMAAELGQQLEKLLVIIYVVKQEILGKEEQIEVLMINGIIKEAKEMETGDLVMK